MSFPQAHHYASTLFRLEESAINTRMKGTTSRFPARLPKQIQRALPIYVALVLIVLFFWKAESIESSIKPADVLKRVLAYQTPLAITHSAFPRKIWQTWKIDPLEFEERDSIRARSWTSLNPSHRYEVLTDGNDLHYVETHFGPTGLNRPDIVYMYRSLTATIIKADLLRYLIMYIEGGVYADIDVEALVPVDRFIPFHFDERDIDLVISVEIDEPKFANHTILGPKSQSFCQWTFMSKPRNPAMLRIINNVIAWLNDVSKRQNVPVAEIHLNFDEVLTGTGPSAFTTAIMAEMTAQTGHAVKWETFHNISEPRLVGSILVLTVEAFAAGQGHSNSGDHNSKKALVKHHYHASLWPSRHQRYSHPAYGMVEECNWNTECVNSWDSNTGVFPSLPEEEQQRLIAAKEQVDRERFDRETAEKEAEEKETADKKAADHLISCMAVVEAAEKALAEGLSEGSATVTATQTVEAAEATPAPEAQEGDATPAPEAQEGDATPASDAQAAGDSPAPEAQATPEAQAPEEAQKPTEQKAEEQAPAAAAETVNMFTPFSVHTDAKRSTNEKRDWRWKDEEQQ